MGNVGFRQFFKPVQPSVRLQKEVGYDRSTAGNSTWTIHLLLLATQV